MTREDLVDELAESLCESVDQKTLLKLYYNVSYEWLESLSKEKLLELALNILGEKMELED